MGLALNPLSCSLLRWQEEAQSPVMYTSSKWTMGMVCKKWDYQMHFPTSCGFSGFFAL